MKKLIIASSVALIMAGQVHGEAGKKGDRWVGGFGELYEIDKDKPQPEGFDADAWGLGIEAGERISDNWAIRIEASYLDIDAVSGTADDSGPKIGADAMYFLPDDAAYLFGGLKLASFNESYTMANIGVGKHWHLNDQWRVISELAGYHDFGQGYRDYSVKVGLAYMFGSSSAPAYKPKDSDGDGVNDSLDKCANTPLGTQVDAMGCALDTDKDGVLDSADQCPNTPMGTKVDSSGCNADLDGDGVLNNLDKCPNTPAGTEVGAKGCSLALDSDQDGILDDADQCAGTPMTDKVDTVGCSVFMEEQVSVDLNVSFGNNSSVIANPDDSKFQEFADFMKRFPATDTVIEGHASAPGDDAYNMKLSQDRANAVKALLVDDFGIDAARLSAVGFGETQLLDTSNTAAAHKTNRRITAKVSASNRVKVER